MNETFKKYRVIAENLSFALIILDQNLRVIFWNHAAEEITGIYHNDIIGKYWGRFFSHLDKNFLKQSLRCLKTGTSFEIDVLLYPKNDSDGYFHVSGFRYTDELVLSFTDVTEKIRTEQQSRYLAQHLQQAYKDVQQVNALKSQFINNINHELRTPLSSITAYLELFSVGLAGQLSGEQQEIIREIQQETNRLHETIENLLELHSIQTGKVQFYPSSCSLSELVTQVVSPFQMRISQKGLRLLINCDNHLPNVWIDRKKIVRVFINILDNAVKFTTQGHIEIRGQQQEHSLNVSIIDTGIGIPQEELDRITDQFHQVDGSMIREHGGMGIGLSVAKHFLAMHNSALKISSIPGQGSQFSFTLSLE